MRITISVDVKVQSEEKEPPKEIKKETYLEGLLRIEAKAKVADWSEWKKASFRSMRWGELFSNDD